VTPASKEELRSEKLSSSLLIRLLLTLTAIRTVNQYVLPLAKGADLLATTIKLV